MLILTKRRLITGAAALAAAAALPHPAAASGTTLIGTADAGSLASTSTTVAISTIGANFIAVAAVNVGVINLSDSAGNAWSNNPPAGFPQGSFNGQFFYATQPIITNASHTFSVSGGGGQCFLVSAWSNMAAASVYDTQTAGATGTGTSLPTGSITPGAAVPLLFAVLADNWTGTPTIDSGFSILGNPRPFNGSSNYAITWAYKLQAAAASVNPTFSWTGGSSANAAKIVSFKGTAAITGRSRLIQ